MTDRGPGSEDTSSEIDGDGPGVEDDRPEGRDDGGPTEHADEAEERADQLSGTLQGDREAKGDRRTLGAPATGTAAGAPPSVRAAPERLEIDDPVSKWWVAIVVGVFAVIFAWALLLGRGGLLSDLLPAAEPTRSAAPTLAPSLSALPPASPARSPSPEPAPASATPSPAASPTSLSTTVPTMSPAATPAPQPSPTPTRPPGPTPRSSPNPEAPAAAPGGTTGT